MARLRVDIFVTTLRPFSPLTLLSPSLSPPVNTSLTLLSLIPSMTIWAMVLTSTLSSELTLNSSTCSAKFSSPRSIASMQSFMWRYDLVWNPSPSISSSSGFSFELLYEVVDYAVFASQHDDVREPVYHHLEAVYVGD